MEPLFVFDNVVAHLINESSRTQTEDIIDEAIKGLIADVKARRTIPKVQNSCLTSSVLRSMRDLKRDSNPESSL